MRDAMNSSANEVEQQRRRNRIIRAVILAVIAILLLGNVFAASISVNSGNPLTFGQGQASVTACDPSVEYSIGSDFVNGSFVVKEIVATIDNTACNGKQLIVIPFEVGGGSTTALDAATLAITGITGTTVFTVGTGASSATDKIVSGVSAGDVAGVALEIKD
jgi:autotransporter adhesin